MILHKDRTAAVPGSRPKEKHVYYRLGDYLCYPAVLQEAGTAVSAQRVSQRGGSEPKLEDLTVRVWDREQALDCAQLWHKNLSSVPVSLEEALSLD